jgi:transcriptional regulator with XRE-family HTH domain
MKFYEQKIVEKARLAREKGLSLRAIEKQLGIPNSTISKWVRDIKIDNHFYKKARLLEKKSKNISAYLLKNYKIDKDKSKILLSLLYWCEGSKYPSTNCVAFSNSDYLMMKTFIELLRTGFYIDEKKIRVRLQLHSTHNESKENMFWSYLLKIPLSQFGKSTITKPKNKRKRLDYRGTCTIKYYDVKLLLNIIGIYESFGKKFS